jgi:EAL domain-containing protein (putative c-di-GMP-specific phosphodiesterase class I)
MTPVAVSTPVAEAGLAGSGLLLVVAVGLLVALLTARRQLRRHVGPDNTSLANHEAARHRIDHVLQRQALDIALQPIVDLTTGRLVGTESLARFRDGRPPDLWLSEATETGQAMMLDRLAFVSAVKLLPRLPSTCYLSVNATPELILHGGLDECVANLRVPHHRLVIEVTEHAKVRNYGELHTCLAPLRERGVRLAIDDTGAGYASFSHVLQLRPDVIKIDRSLIANITDDAARRSLVTALVLLALDLGASVTAEGVETTSELRTLATLGVDCAQGYLLARPSLDHARWRRWLDPDRAWEIGLATVDSGRSVTIPDRPLV